MALSHVLGSDMIFLAVNEAPHLVHLHTLGREVAHRQVVIVSGQRSRIREQPENRDFVHAEHPAGRGDAVSFDQCGKDRSTTFGWHLVHVDYCSNSYPVVNKIPVDNSDFYY